MGRAQSKFRVTTTIRNMLISSEDIKGYVGEKIFPLIAPEGTDGDFILYKRDQYRIDRTKMGICRQEAKVYINIVSSDYDRSQQIAESVFECLDGEWGNPAVVIHMEDSTEDYTDGKYIQILLFSIV